MFNLLFDDKTNELLEMYEDRSEICLQILCEMFFVYVKNTSMVTVSNSVKL
jgi:hypothetical protein